MSTSLWNFALDLYARPGVEQACLRLQDEHDTDVCLLLCGAWLQRRGVRCTALRAEQLRRLAQGWQGDVIRPLRELRRQWKEQAAQDEALAALRERLAQLELDAERELLRRLEDLSGPWPAEVGRTADWLAALAGPDADRAALDCLAAAARA